MQAGAYNTSTTLHTSHAGSVPVNQLCCNPEPSFETGENVCTVTIKAGKRKGTKAQETPINNFKRKNNGWLLDW